jgi:hypothetical protein
MKRIPCIIFALFAAPAFAVGSSSGTSVNGTGVVLNGTANQTVGSKVVTVTVGNGMRPAVSATPNTGPSNVSAGTFSAGLSIGATLGSGFGGTSGNAGTVAGGLPGF